jgi:hypothetical protein
MRLCPGCATQVGEGDAACPHCRAPLSRPADPALQEQADPAARTGQDEPADLTAETAKTIRKSEIQRERLRLAEERKNARRFERPFVITVILVLGVALWRAVTDPGGNGLALCAGLVTAPLIGAAIAFVYVSCHTLLWDLVELCLWIVGWKPAGPDPDEVARRLENDRILPRSLPPAGPSGTAEEHIQRPSESITSRTAPHEGTELRESPAAKPEAAGLTSPPTPTGRPGK